MKAEGEMTMLKADRFVSLLDGQSHEAIVDIQRRIETLRVSMIRTTMWTLLLVSRLFAGRLPGSPVVRRLMRDLAGTNLAAHKGSWTRRRASRRTTPVLAEVRQRRCRGTYLQ
jgi:hypothetical protein